MTQGDWIVLLLKIVFTADAAAIMIFIADYSRLAPWWRQPIGQTLVVKDILLLIPITLGLLSVFFHFNRLTSEVAAWMTVAAFGLIAPVMLWRTWLFEKVHKRVPDALAGIAELAAYLDVPEEQARELTARGGFPAPAAVLALGSVWRLGPVAAWISAHDAALAARLPR
jgi:hypothetical protein